MRDRERSIEWGALLYELKRARQTRMYKIGASDWEWAVPVTTGFRTALVMFCVSVFLGLFLYWDVPVLLFTAIIGPMIFARKSWVERNPTFKDSPAAFIASCGYSSRTWGRAGLLTGLLLSVFYGTALALGLAYVYGADLQFDPFDRGILLEVATPPMLCSYFYLLFLSAERKRYLRKIKVPLKARLRREIIPGDPIMYVFLLFIILLTVMDLMTLQERALRFGAVMIGMMGLTFLGVVVYQGIRRSSVFYIYPLLCVVALGLYFFLFYMLGMWGIKGLPRVLSDYAPRIEGPVAVAVLGLLLVLAARKAMKDMGEVAFVCSLPQSREET